MKPSLRKDLIAGVVVSLVALPLCLGIALASGAPPIAGIMTGIIGGILVGFLSGSHTSVSGPAAGLTTIVAAEITGLGTFQAFLLALIIAGVVQIGLGILRAGALSVFFPSSVIKGLLAAIGIILILKQFPHLLGHDADPEGEFAFVQPDHENTFSEIGRVFIGELHSGAMAIGLVSLAFLILWDRIPSLKKSSIPSALVVVAIGIGMAEFLRQLGSGWIIESSHLVEVPVAKKWTDYLGFFQVPDYSRWADWNICKAGLTIALVASLETLINLEAVDKLDLAQRRSPPNRELVAQGIGNVACGLIGGIPLTSVVVRSSVNVHAGATSKRSAITHGVLLLIAVTAFPLLLNKIPIACLAAILLVTGFKLASPKLFKQMLLEGRYQFIPFFATLVAIVLTDLVIGVGIGLVISLAFILHSNLRAPIRQVRQHQIAGEVLHVQLSNQVSFLNRASLEEVLYRAKRGTHVLLDASGTDYIDPDIISLIRDFREKAFLAHGVTVSTRGFKDRFRLDNRMAFAEYSTKQLQERLSPDEVIEYLRIGNDRFRSGNRLSRDLGQQIQGTAASQHPLAVILSCIDSRSPAELVFDLGIGDVFSVRIAGNFVRTKVLGSMEYACAIAGAKLIVVMGHTRCGAINSTIELTCAGHTASSTVGCQNLDYIIEEIRKSIDPSTCQRFDSMTQGEKDSFIELVTRQNVTNAMREVLISSQKLREMRAENQIAVVGALYKIETGVVEFFAKATSNGTIETFIVTPLVEADGPVSRASGG